MSLWEFLKAPCPVSVWEWLVLYFFAFVVGFVSAGFAIVMRGCGIG